jgi:PIN domain nuclease of toxin-antitoxin system
MNYLLDTHTFLWFIGDDSSLSVDAKSFIESAENLTYLSIASIWEMAIKVSLNKLAISSPFINFISTQCVENGVEILDIKFEHIGLVATLPFHHRDPFDRLIIAQSLHEQLPIISMDNAFDSYGVERIW